VSRIPPDAIGALGFDPEAVLLKEPGILLNPHFLGALHAELRNELGSIDANLTLLQMGFLHGLQDAMRAVQTAFGSESAAPRSPTGPALAFRLCSDGQSTTPGSIALSGIWPEHIEASAYRAAFGPPRRATCYLSAGYTSGWLSGTLGADVLAVEASCCACGGDHCRFSAREAAAWRESGDPAALEILEALPFAAFRAFVQVNLESSDDSGPRSECVGPGSAVIHIWGPVMVVPFANGDAALNAVELIGRDPAARNVSVVVLDLSGAILDEAYGAIALEQLLDLVDAWGADAIFAAVSPLSEAVIADLERQPLMILKDLSEAIAAAFRLANAQRHPS
jgi:hypothetical protein